MRPNQTEPGRTTTPRAEDLSPEAPERARAITRDDGDGDPDRLVRTGPQTRGDTAMSWQDIKGRFVDDPAGAIAAAEQLLERALEERIRALHDEAAQLRVRNGEGDDDASSTEALRARLLRYQEYCERLTSASVH